MPDLTPDVSDPHKPAGANAPGAKPKSDIEAPVNPVGSGDTDPFDTLFKMSTTAGLGSAEYVAINGTAIAAVLLGIASALVLFGSLLLLLIPIAGIVCAISAFRQIQNSNGTQSGRVLAAIGFLLSLGIGGFYVGNEAMEAARDRADQGHLIALIENFGDLIHSAKYAEAYALFDDRFSGRVSAAEFSGKWKLANSNPYYGGVKSMDWNHVLKFDTDPVTGERTCSAMVLLSFEKVPGKEREGMAFRKLDGKWWIDDIPNMFPQQTTPGGPNSGHGGSPQPAGPAGPPAPKP